MEAKRKGAAARGLELLQFSSFDRRDQELKGFACEKKNERAGILEHEETPMGLATLCIHVFQASQVHGMRGFMSDPQGQ